MAYDGNKHIWDYLTYYLNLTHPPCFAVLLSGPWGVGKTYLLKAFLKKYFGGSTDKYVYVSLYGLSSIEEIDDALFQAAFPAFTGTAAKVAGRVVKAGLKFLRVEPGEWSIKEFLNKFDANAYVFDDLERCEAPINKVLGYINQFVEHGSAKVIILANEREIGPNEDYTRRREKLIGKSLAVVSVFDEAFTHFLSNVDDDEARTFIRNSAADIETIHIQSDLHNLRILQQTMWDFERFYLALLPDHRANKEAMANLIRLLFVLSFELKSARITEQDIVENRGMTARVIAELNKDRAKTPIAVTGERYPMVDIDDSVLSNELLVDYLVRGVVNPSAIRKELDASRFFLTVADEEPWRTVWHWFERSDAEFNSALAKMNQQYDDRAFTKDGAILHVLGLRLFLSDRGILPLSRAEVVADGRKYIDEVCKAKTLELPSSGDVGEIRFQGWAGLGISEHDTEDYKALFQHLMSAIQHSVEDTYPETARRLLSEMSTDVERFYRQISLSHADASQYIRAPVLAKLPVDDFVKAFLGLHPSGQRMVMAALKGRYEYGRLQQDLKEEQSWITSVHEALLNRLPELNGISRYRLERQIEWYLKANRPETEATNE
jgi:GTPase SAR1 family protein